VEFTGLTGNYPNDRRPAQAGGFLLHGFMWIASIIVPHFMPRGPAGNKTECPEIGRICVQQGRGKTPKSAQAETKFRVMIST
jgi:hypothetical protein